MNFVRAMVSTTQHLITGHLDSGRFPLVEASAASFLTLYLYLEQDAEDGVVLGWKQ
jgi:hypothetical protein